MKVSHPLMKLADPLRRDHYSMAAAAPRPPRAWAPPPASFSGDGKKPRQGQAGGSGSAFRRRRRSSVPELSDLHEFAVAGLLSSQTATTTTGRRHEDNSAPAEAAGHKETTTTAAAQHVHAGAAAAGTLPSSTTTKTTVMMTKKPATKVDTAQSVNSKRPARQVGAGAGGPTTTTATTSTTSSNRNNLSVKTTHSSRKHKNKDKTIAAAAAPGPPGSVAAGAAASAPVSTRATAAGTMTTATPGGAGAGSSTGIAMTSMSTAATPATTNRASSSTKQHATNEAKFEAAIRKQRHQASYFSRLIEERSSRKGMQQLLIQERQRNNDLTAKLRSLTSKHMQLNKEHQELLADKHAMLVQERAQMHQQMADFKAQTLAELDTTAARRARLTDAQQEEHDRQIARSAEERITRIFALKEKNAAEGHVAVVEELRENLRSKELQVAELINWKRHAEDEISHLVDERRRLKLKVGVMTAAHSHLRSYRVLLKYSACKIYTIRWAYFKRLRILHQTLSLLAVRIRDFKEEDARSDIHASRQRSLMPQDEVNAWIKKDRQLYGAGTRIVPKDEMALFTHLGDLEQIIGIALREYRARERQWKATCHSFFVQATATGEELKRVDKRANRLRRSAAEQRRLLKYVQSKAGISGNGADSTAELGSVEDTSAAMLLGSGSTPTIKEHNIGGGGGGGSKHRRGLVATGQAGDGSGAGANMRGVGGSGDTQQQRPSRLQRVQHLQQQIIKLRNQLHVSQKALAVMQSKYDRAVLGKDSLDKLNQRATTMGVTPAQAALQQAGVLPQTKPAAVDEQQQQQHDDGATESGGRVRDTIYTDGKHSSPYVRGGVATSTATLPRRSSRGGARGGGDGRQRAIPRLPGIKAEISGKAAKGDSSARSGKAQDATKRRPIGAIRTVPIIVYDD